MKKICSCLIGVAIFLYSVIFAQAECTGVCLQYCGNPGGSHGYCVDYIYDRLKVRQSGNAVNWIGTDGLSMDEVQVNDVAIFGATSSNPYGHVAVVDSVEGDNITISEWNFGYPSNNSVELSCGVTTQYHNTTTRTIAKSSVSRFWRPETVAPCESNIQITLQIVGNVGWYPNYLSCVSANAWYNIIEENGEKLATSANEGPTICWSIQYSLYGVDYDVIFGSQPLTCHQ
jgi:hypothetical protein